LQIQIFIVDLWINEKVMTAIEASYVLLACKYNLMALPIESSSLLLSSYLLLFC
jgi:hypothetical protein